MDILIAGNDGEVWTILFIQGATAHGWSAPWTKILPSGINLVPRSPISAVSPSQGSIDIFWADSDGHITSASWHSGDAGWHRCWNIKNGTHRIRVPWKGSFNCDLDFQNLQTPKGLVMIGKDESDPFSVAGIQEALNSKLLAVNAFHSAAPGVPPSRVAILVFVSSLTMSIMATFFKPSIAG